MKKKSNMVMKSMLLSFSMNYCFSWFIDGAIQKVLSSRLIMNSRAALELVQKAQVFEGQGIYGHFEI